MFNSLNDHPLFRQRAETTSLTNIPASYSDEFKKSLDSLSTVLDGLAIEKHRVATVPDLNSPSNSNNKNFDALDQTLTNTESSSAEDDAEKDSNNEGSSSGKSYSNDDKPARVEMRSQLRPQENQAEQPSTSAAHKVSQDGYLVPVENAELNLDSDEPVCPFPFPSSSEIKTKTDLTSLESNFAKSFNSATPTHRYSNIIENSFLDPQSDQRRFELLEDLVEKQTDYMFILDIVFKEYFSDTIIQEKVLSLAPDRRVKLFGHLQALWHFHKTLLTSQLSERVKNWSNKRAVCDIFAKNLKQIELYDFFIINLTETFKFIDECCEIESFRNHLNHINGKVARLFARALSELRIEFPANFTFKSFLAQVLIWPEFANRFLIAYENFLNVDHPEASDFSKCIEYFNELATKACETMQDAKHAEELRNLQDRLGNKFSILDRKRVLIKEGQLVTQSPHLGSIIRIYIVLLNDLLIICDQADNQYQSLKPKRPLDAIGMTVSSDVTAYTLPKDLKKMAKRQQVLNPDLGFAINVPCIQKVFKFYARNMQEKNKWFVAFETVAQANKFQTEINRAMIGKKAPKWIPDLLCQYCFKCNSEFTTLNRRHHCRACGNIFCNRCSKMEACLEFDEGRRGRVCDFCYDFLNATFRSAPPSIEQLEGRSRRV